MKYSDNYSSPGRVEDRRYNKPIFIHYGVDDARLTQSQFRVYAHLTRRAGMKDRAYPGIDSISDKCLMSPATAIKAIRELERRKMIIVERESGKTSLYGITDTEEWLEPPKPPLQSTQRTVTNQITLPLQSSQRKIQQKDTPSKKGSFSIEKQEEEDDIPF